MRIGVQDTERADMVMKDPSIFPYILDDISNDYYKENPYSLKPVLEIDAIYVLMPDDLSVFLAVPVNGTTYDFHCNIVKSNRGEKGDSSFRAAIDYLFDETPCEKLVSYIPSCFMNVKRHSERMGFKQEGRLTNSISRGGIFYDHFIVSLNRDKWLK